MIQARNDPKKTLAAGIVLRVGLVGQGRQQAWTTTSVICAWSTKQALNVSRMDKISFI